MPKIHYYQKKMEVIVDIALVRDWIIVITGVIEILILILLGIIGWAVYKKIQELSGSLKKISISAQSVIDSAEGVVDSVKVTTNNVAQVTTFARTQIVEPLIKTASAVQGISAGLNSILGFFQRKGR